MNTTIAWILIIAGLTGGIASPILLRRQTKSKSVTLHVVGWIWWFFFAFVGSQIVLAIFALSMGQETLEQTEFAAAFQTLTYFAMFAVMVWLPVRQWRRGQLEKGNKKAKTVKKNKKIIKTDTNARPFILKLSGLDRKPTWGDVKKFLSFFPLYFVTNLVASMILLAILGEKIMGQEQNVGFSTTGNTPLSLILIFLCLVVLAPLFEEMLVRGALFSKLREKLKFWPAAIFTASVFALIHGQFNVGVMTFILALYAAFLREKTGAIWSGIMLHMAQNGIAFCLLFLG